MEENESVKNEKNIDFSKIEENKILNEIYIYHNHWNETCIIDDRKIIHFGDDRYEDYTTHKNEARNKLDLARHKHDKFTNPLYASFYSTNLLWSKPTLTEAIRSTNNKSKGVNIP